MIPRHWLRVSLRTLLAVTTIVGIWLGFRVNAARRQAHAIAEIKRLGGTFYYDFEYDFKELRRLPTARSWVPRWILDHTGCDLFHDIVQVNMVYDAEPTGPKHNNQQFTDQFKLQLHALPRLRDLLCYEGQASDDCLLVISRLPRLERLTCWDAPAVTDAGVAYLARMPRLKEVTITGSQITDESLRFFGTMRQLDDLNVQGGRFTDRGLAYLHDLGHLKNLAVDLGDTHITDAGLAHLEKLTELRRIWIMKTNVTDEGVARLQRALPKLHVLATSPTASTQTGTGVYLDSDHLIPK
jgi:hypothetical protein